MKNIISRLLTLLLLTTLTMSKIQAQVPVTGGTFTGLVNFDEGINPKYEPANYNNHILLNEGSFNNGFSYHNISGATGYPNGTGSVWTFKQGATRLHQLHFSKNSNKFHISSWHSANGTWNEWERVLTDKNYSTIMGFTNLAGNVGIGTTSPDRQLQVENFTNAIFNIKGGNTSVSLQIQTILMLEC